jgi:hypothetical protein
MKNIIDLYEASILGNVEDTMKIGDDLIDKANQEFENIKLSVQQHKLWEKRVTTYFRGNKTRYRLDFSIKNIAEAFSLKPNNLLLVDAIKDDETNKWQICLMIHSNNGPVRDYKSFRKEISQNQVRNFPSLIKSHILPYFDNVNTLIDTIYEKS